MAVVYIGLGSNVGNREEYLAVARKSIVQRCGAVITAESSVLETRAVDFEEQPDFLNQVIKIETGVEPFSLLKLLKGIEEDMGRVYRFPKGPREIDLDILLYDDSVIASSVLNVPHPGILKRDFIVRQLAELDPELADPVSKKIYSEVMNHAVF